MSVLNKGIGRRAVLGLMGGAIAAPYVITKARAADVVLRLHHFLPPVSNVHRKFFVPWAKSLEEQTGGKLEVQIFPAMQLGGKAPQLADQARDGIADITWSLPVYTPSKFPIAESFSLPFMVTNATDTSVAMWKVMEEFGQREYRGVKPLAFHVHGAGKFHMRSKAIQSTADLSGIKMRAPNQTFGKLLKKLGAEPVFFPVTEMAVGLSSGVIDGTCLPYEVVPAFKLQELTAKHCEAAAGARGLYSNSFALLMNQRKYESLPEDVRQVIDINSGEAASRALGKAFDSFEVTGRRMIIDRKSNEIVEIPADQIAGWRDASGEIAADWVEVLNKRRLDGAAILARANQLIDGQG